MRSSEEHEPPRVLQDRPDKLSSEPRSLTAFNRTYRPMSSGETRAPLGLTALAGLNAPQECYTMQVAIEPHRLNTSVSPSQCKLVN